MIGKVRIVPASARAENEGRPGDGGIRDLGRPVVYDLLASVRHRVFGGTEGGSEYDRESSFLGDFPHGGLRGSFPGIDLALGNGDIRAVAPMNDENFDATRRLTPADRSRSLYGRGSGEGHRTTPVRFLWETCRIRTFCMSSSSEPSSAR